MMPIAKYQLPDGRVAKFEVPEGTTPEQAQAYGAQYFSSQQEQPQTQPEQPSSSGDSGLTLSDLIAPKKKDLPYIAPENRDGVLRGTLRSVIQGASFNWGDEARIAEEAAKMKAKGDARPFGEIYDEQRKVFDATRADFKKEHPYLDVGGELGGALITASRTGNIGGITSAMSKGEKLLRLGAVGGGMGVLSGSGAAKEGERIEGGLKGGTTGFALGVAIPAVLEPIKKGASAIINRIKSSNIPDEQLAAQADDMLRESGIDLRRIPQSIRNQMMREMRRAANTGGEVDPAVLQRIADYGAVGATPTRGTVTLDPSLITQERNLAKIGANSPDKRLQELNRIANSNNAAMINKANELGAGKAPDQLTAGARLIEYLKNIDAPRKAAVDTAYKAVRDSSGRAAPLNNQAFANAANDALDSGQLGYFLPQQVRGILNDVSAGKIPLNVNTATQMDSVLSGAARDAATKGDGRAAAAINLVRKALNDAPIDDAAGMETKALYEKARSLAANRFKLIEQNPALAAALDDAAPDKFVQSFITGSGGKSNFRDVAALAKELKQSPEALNAAKSQILAHLKDKALGGAADEVGNFSGSNYNKALKAIGDDKLRLFFSPSEIADMKALGRVASYETVQPRGSAVNNSNTGGALAGIADRLANNRVLMSVPFARGGIVEPINNWLARGQANQALNPANALYKAPQAEPSEIINMLARAASMQGGAASSR